MARIINIQGSFPAEYAAQWGDPSTEVGRMCYNCSTQAGTHGVANTGWFAREWFEFAKLLFEEWQANKQVLAEEGEKAPYKPQDIEGLRDLCQWAMENALHGPVTYTYTDGESGQEIVRVSERVVFTCSRQGSVDACVKKYMAGGTSQAEVTWLADEDEIRKSLKGYGAWDNDELSDPEANKERILRLACCDIAESPESYA